MLSWRFKHTSIIYTANQYFNSSLVSHLCYSNQIKWNQSVIIRRKLCCFRIQVYNQMCISCVSWADFQVLQSLEPSFTNHPLPHLFLSLPLFAPLSPFLSVSLSFCKLCLFPVCRGPSGGEVRRKGKAHSEFKCTGLKTKLTSTKGNYNGETMGKQWWKHGIMTCWKGDCWDSRGIILWRRREFKKMRSGK